MSKVELNLFEEATRENWTFQTSKGMVNVQSLWTMHLTSRSGDSLASIGDAIDEKLVSLSGAVGRRRANRSNATAEVKLLEKQLALVDRIIEVREIENAAKTNAAANAARAAQLRDIIAQKQGEATMQKSVEELQAELAALEAAK